jgi:hypothetical protein
MDTIERAFKEYPPNLLNRVWITHQTIMDKIIAYRDENCFKLLHIGKGALENQLIFEPTIPVSDEALHVLREDNTAEEMLGIARNRFIVDDVDDVDESQFY